MADEKITPMSGKSFASAAEHIQSWNDLCSDYVLKQLMTVNGTLVLPGLCQHNGLCSVEGLSDLTGRL
ncbi:hypothetical protein MTR67_009230 [Solanum verrucosum]|uniref:Uncharacterized protein n=1 Tax=Solanum verrucosum TaxID=315347 RepID=A0AAF0Q595_SOLVR|nr:hypothetical protein MTR67_009230 [Solanum verrucosum]